MIKKVILIILTSILFACSNDNESHNPPSINILSPANNSTFGVGEEIIFQGNVNDTEDSGSQLEISISSSIQGSLATNIPITNNSFSYIRSNLTESEHLITITVTDSDNVQRLKTVTINISDPHEPVTLNPTSVQNGELLLNWSVSNESKFESYNIMRSENEGRTYEVIDTISNINITNYTDSNVEFGVSYIYKISTTLLNSTVVPVSNIESGIFETGNFIDLGTDIVRLKIDPVRPYIYALDEYNGNILVINKQTLQVENTISVGSSNDMDISLDNSKLYVAWSYHHIVVVDLDTQQIINTFKWDADLESDVAWPTRIVCIGNDKLVVLTHNGYDNIALINANNGEILSWTDSLFYVPSLITSPDRMSVLVIEHFNSTGGSIGNTAYRYNLETNGLMSPTSVDNTGDISCNTYAATAFSGNGEFIFYCGKKIAYNDLSTPIGTFDEGIHASNNDGSIVIGSKHIWDANNFNITKSLPFTNSGTMVLDNSTDIVYIYYHISGKLYYFDIN